jgi:plasmid maintenance system killer protein
MRAKLVFNFALKRSDPAHPWGERAARRKLDRLESATSLKDLAALPGNRLER